MSSFRNFVLALAATFLAPWLCLVVIPHAKMKAQEVQTWEDKELGTKSSYPAGTPHEIDINAPRGAVQGVGSAGGKESAG